MDVAITNPEKNRYVYNTESQLNDSQNYDNSQATSQINDQLKDPSAKIPTPANNVASDEVATNIMKNNIQLKTWIWRRIEQSQETALIT